MPASFNSPEAVQESASANNENVAAQHAYRLIRQLRYHIMARPTGPTETPKFLDNRATELEVRSDRAAGF